MPRSLASRSHGPDLVRLPDVARVEPQALNAGLERGKRQAVLVVDVGDDRHRRARHYLSQPLGGGDIVCR